MQLVEIVVPIVLDDADVATEVSGSCKRDGACWEDASAKARRYGGGVLHRIGVLNGSIGEPLLVATSLGPE